MRRSLYLLPLIFLLGNEGFAKTARYSDNSADDCKEKNSGDRYDENRNSAKSAIKNDNSAGNAMKNDGRYDNDDKESFGPLVGKFKATNKKLSGGACTFNLKVDVNKDWRLGYHNLIANRDRNLRIGLRNEGTVSDILNVSAEFSSKDATKPVKENIRIDGTMVKENFFPGGIITLPVKIKGFDAHRSIIQIDYVACKMGEACSTEGGSKNIGTQILELGEECK